MAVVNGSPCAAALAADVALAARRRLEAAEASSRSPSRHFARRSMPTTRRWSLWGDEHEIAALRGLRGWLEGAAAADRLDHQAPVSYRILPRVLGQAHRAVERSSMRRPSRCARSRTTPSIVPPDERHPLGRVISTGGYHNGIASPAMSALAASLGRPRLPCRAARHGDARRRHERPSPLLERPGGGGGKTNLLGWVAGSFLEDARTAALRDSAAVRNRRCAERRRPSRRSLLPQGAVAADCLDSALALLAASSSQALWATDRAPAPPLRPLLDRVRSVFAPVDDPAGRRIGESSAGWRRSSQRPLAQAQEALPEWPHTNVCSIRSQG